MKMQVLISSMFLAPVLAVLPAAHSSECASDGPMSFFLPTSYPHAGVNMLQQSTRHATEVVQLESLGSLKNLSVSQLSLHHSGSDKGGPGGESIFEQSFEDLDKLAYHIIFAIMILFTIIVDRVQTWISNQAEASVVERRLVSRVNAELMMFGIVGISIFVTTNLWKSMPKEWALFLTYADILASFAAVIMILVSVMLSVIKRAVMPQLTSLEIKMLERKELTQTSMPDLDQLESDNTGWFSLMGAKDYDLMASAFIKMHKLPEGVRYCNYLEECLVLSACDIMDIQWSSWLAVLVFSLFSILDWAVRISHRAVTVNFSYYLKVYAVTNWAMFFCSLGIFFIADRAYNKMLLYLAAIGRKEEAELESPISGKTPSRMKTGMQVVTLGTAFDMAFFVMTLIYNLNKSHYGWATYALLLAPMFFSTVVILPATIFRFTIVDAFYEPHHEALDMLFEKYDRLEDDFNYLSRLYERKGRPKLPELDKGCDPDSLAIIVRNLGFHISITRLHRIFENFDKDGDGLVDSEEFFTMLTQSATDSVSRSQGFAAFSKEARDRKFVRNNTMVQQRRRSSIL